MRTDRFGLDGYRQQAAIGVTDAVVVPWVFDGLGFAAPVERKKDSIKKIADEVVGKLRLSGCHGYLSVA